MGGDLGLCEPRVFSYEPVLVQIEIWRLHISEVYLLFVLKFKLAYEMIPFLGNIGLVGHDIDKYLLFPQKNHSFTC
jgi:hypothetical protein